MHTITALIIDDEPLAHKVILEYAKDLPFLQVVGQCYKATDAYAQMDGQAIDLLFLDINMPRLKGLDFLRTLEQKPKVIITSAYEEYALASFDLQVSDYLLKPFRFDRFLQAVNKVQRELAPNAISYEVPPAKAEHGQMFLKVDKRHLLIQIDDIQFLESYGNYVKVWIKDKPHLTLRTLSSFEAELDHEAFARVHKSFLIQKRFIHYLEGHQLMMKNGQYVPIGKNFRTAVKQWLS
ncbi:MAG: LytTR family DNA-binding domain-containing protein [Bacteroidota bacterium]